MHKWKGMLFWQVSYRSADCLHMVHNCHEFCFSLNTSQQAVWCYYFQSIAETHEFPFQLKVRNDVQAKRNSCFCFFHNLLGCMNGFCFYIRRLLEVGLEYNPDRLVGCIAGNADNILKIGLRVKTFEQAKRFMWQGCNCLYAVESKCADFFSGF